MSEFGLSEDNGRHRRFGLAFVSLISGLVAVPLHGAYMMGLISNPWVCVLFSGVLALTSGLLAITFGCKRMAGTNGFTSAIGGVILGGVTVIVGLFDAPTTSPDRARQTQSRSIATTLELSLSSFQEEYGYLPNVANRVETNSPEGIKLLTILIGLEGESGTLQNTRTIKFLNVREGKNKRNGLIYSPSGTSIEGLYDSWGNPFTVISGVKPEEGLRFNIGSKAIELQGRRTAAFSPGPDKKLGTSDDVRTW